MSAATAAVLLIVLFFSVLAYAAGKPSPSGSVVLKRNGTVIDATNASEGYITVHHKKYEKRLKLRIICAGETYTYDLNSSGEDEVFPLQEGSGKYEVRVYEQVSGNRYSQASAQSFTVEMTNENSAFLCSNQYVSYSSASKCVSDAGGICAGLTSDQSKTDAVFGHLSTVMTYDYIQALMVDTGYLPDVDAAYEKKSGICFDLAALMAAMLRSQGVPCKLVIGYADKTYHAWNAVLINGEWKLYDLTRAITKNKIKSYTAEREY